MIPILFTESTTSFTTNGIGRLQECIKCIVKEELNGGYELEIEYPITGVRYTDLKNSAIIGVIPYDGCENIQGFRIYEISKPLNGRITVFAEHISYQRYWIPVMPFTASSLSDCIAKLKVNSVETNPFTIITDKSVASAISFTEPKDFGTMLQGEQGSVLQTYKGEYEYDNYTIKLLNNRGSNNGVTLRYGKNIIDGEQETNIENTYTGIVPFWADTDGNMVTLPERVVQSSQASQFPYNRTKVIDFSSDFESQPTEDELRTHTKQYIENNNIGHPNVNVTVEFVPLWQSKEYENIAPLERVKLGDTVSVIFDNLGVTEQAKVVAYEYDVLRERYNKIQIGEVRSTLAKTIASQSNEIEASRTETKQLVSNATAWLTRGDGYLKIVRNEDGSWRELLAMDTPDDKTAQKVLRLNQYGIGFSDSGVDGPYNQAWTLDGVFTTGGLNNAYGHIQVLDESSNIVGEWDNERFVLRQGSGSHISIELKKDPGYIPGIYMFQNKESGYDYTFAQYSPSRAFIEDLDEGSQVQIFPTNINVKTRNGTYDNSGQTAITYEGIVTPYLRCKTLVVDESGGGDYVTQDDLDAVYQYIDDQISEVISMIMS